VQELEHLAKENLKVRAAIQGRRPVYSAQRMEHEYLEHVSRVERLATFRGPKSAQHLPKQVRQSVLRWCSAGRVTRHTSPYNISLFNWGQTGLQCTLCTERQPHMFALNTVLNSKQSCFLLCR
jgi:hypothetical protein